MLKSEALQILEQKVAACERCQELCQYRKDNNYKTVPGTGNPNARVMIIGEAPGENEAKQGLPFVGRAGNLLTNILSAAGIDRRDVFIANMLKCRPPGNRDPEPGEVSNCRQFLDLQIKCIKPEWIVCLGRIASVHLLGRDVDDTMGSMRHKVHEYKGCKVICTYHPAYLLRNPAAKADVWNDLQPLVFALRSPRADV